MTQFLNTDRTWNSLKIRLLLLPRKRTFKLIVVIGFICGLIFIEDVKQHSSWDQGQYSDKEILISLRGWFFHCDTQCFRLFLSLTPFPVTAYVVQGKVIIFVVCVCQFIFMGVHVS